MYKGYYNAVSGMLTQQRVLNTISNNMTNASTPGFKKDITTSTTFNEVMTYRFGNMDKRRPTSLDGELASMRTVDERVTLFEQGGLYQTDRAFDFALSGDGFFEIATIEGNVYTRNGAFTLDEQGYLALNGGGRVLGTAGQIQLNTDQFSVGPDGTIYREDGSTAGQVRIVDFEDYDTLEKNAAGFFTGEGGTAVNGQGVTAMNYALEESNVSVMDETVNMIEAQRAFQSASQIFRMYDQLNEKSDELGRV